jgi:hypothetical protein
VTDRTHLRIPGPTPLPDRVREAGSRPDDQPPRPGVPRAHRPRHRPPAAAFATQQRLHILTASGTGGMEAAIVNHLSPATRCWRSASAPSATASPTSPALRRRRPPARGRVGPAPRIPTRWPPRCARWPPRAAAKAVLLTHNETSTGVTNPLAELAAAVQRLSRDADHRRRHQRPGRGAVRDRRLGPRRGRHRLAEELDGAARGWPWSPARSAPGRRAEQARCRAITSTSPRRASTPDKGETPWTPAVSVLLQLDVALELLEREGYPRIFARHAACGAGRAKPAWRRWASGCWPIRARVDTVTAAWLPDGVEWAVVQPRLRGRGLVLAGGQGKLSRPDPARRPPGRGPAGRRRREAIEIIERPHSQLELPVEEGAGAPLAPEREGEDPRRRAARRGRPGAAAPRAARVDVRADLARDELLGRAARLRGAARAQPGHGRCRGARGRQPAAGRRPGRGGRRTTSTSTPPRVPA